ncbi:MAG: hypothetical protein AAF378_00810 [Cyanobacteria bacterium P01_A01_bin.84]
MSTQPANKLSGIRRFVYGLLVGLFFAGLLYLYSVYFYVYIPLVQGIIGSLVLGISCGAIALTNGVDKVFDNLPKI